MDIYEGEYQIKIVGYKIGQEANFAELVWTVKIYIDCNTDAFTVTNHPGDIEIMIQPPVNSEYTTSFVSDSLWHWAKNPRTYTMNKDFTHDHPFSCTP